MEFAGEVIAQQDPSMFAGMGDFFTFLFHTPFFTVLKFFAAIYTAVIVVDIILLLILSGVDESYRKNQRGSNMPRRAEAARKWGRIKARLKKGEQNYFKAAILEADQMVEKILVDNGYGQETMGQKIDQLEAQHVDGAKFLREAHNVSMQVVQDPEFEITKERTEEVLNMYEEFMDDMEVFG